MNTTTELSQLPAWQALAAHAGDLRPRHLRDLFAEDPARFARLSLPWNDLLYDFSKQRLTGTTLSLLTQLAIARDVPGWISRLFSGERINLSENRAALHIALRQPDTAALQLDGVDLLAQVRQTRTQMRQLCEAVRSDAWRGHAGDPIRAVVSLGIGGSDLGPRMATEALSAHSHPTLTVHYVSNLDGADIAPVLERLDPRSTLFVVTSKTFTTQETLTNARTARDWLLASTGSDPAAADRAMQRQFFGVTAHPAAALQFGIHPDNLFAFWDWVGGRFSLWSAVGLPLALAIGMDAFEALLHGAHEVDEHLRSAPLERNLPVLMALVGLWNINFLGAQHLSVVPYSQSLRLLPDYLQQLDMESNGKSVDRHGQPLQMASAPILWGGAGSNVQHAYFQLLHQGSHLVPSEFIAIANSDYPLPGHHDRLIANCLAQAEALAFGSGAADPLRHCAGNQPSSLLFLPRLDPRQLGRLLALYEHKIFVQGVLWGINSFDQWGVELGKQLAARLLPAVSGASAQAASPALDPSTAGLIAWYRQHAHP